MKLIPVSKHILKKHRKKILSKKKQAIKHVDKDTASSAAPNSDDTTEESVLKKDIPTSKRRPNRKVRGKKQSRAHLPSSQTVGIVESESSKQFESDPTQVLVPVIETPSSEVKSVQTILEITECSAQTETKDSHGKSSQTDPSESKEQHGSNNEETIDANTQTSPVKKQMSIVQSPIKEKFKTESTPPHPLREDSVESEFVVTNTVSIMQGKSKHRCKKKARSKRNVPETKEPLVSYPISFDSETEQESKSLSLSPDSSEILDSCIMSKTSVRINPVTKQSEVTAETDVSRSFNASEVFVDTVIESTRVAKVSTFSECSDAKKMVKEDFASLQLEESLPPKGEHSPGPPDIFAEDKLWDKNIQIDNATVFGSPSFELLAEVKVQETSIYSQEFQPEVLERERVSENASSIESALLPLEESNLKTSSPVPLDDTCNLSVTGKNMENESNEAERLVLESQEPPEVARDSSDYIESSKISIKTRIDSLKMASQLFESPGSGPLMLPPIDRSTGDYTGPSVAENISQVASMYCKTTELFGELQGLYHRVLGMQVSKGDFKEMEKEITEVESVVEKVLQKKSALLGQLNSETNQVPTEDKEALHSLVDEFDSQMDFVLDNLRSYKNDHPKKIEDRKALSEHVCTLEKSIADVQNKLDQFLRLGNEVDTKDQLETLDELCCENHRLQRDCKEIIDSCDDESIRPRFCKLLDAIDSQCITLVKNQEGAVNLELNGLYKDDLEETVNNLSTPLKEIDDIILDYDCVSNSDQLLEKIQTFDTLYAYLKKCSFTLTAVKSAPSRKNISLSDDDVVKIENDLTKTITSVMNQLTQTSSLVDNTSELESCLGKEKEWIQSFNEKLSDFSPVTAENYSQLIGLHASLLEQIALTSPVKVSHEHRDAKLAAESADCALELLDVWYEVKSNLSVLKAFDYLWAQYSKKCDVLENWCDKICDIEPTLASLNDNKHWNLIAEKDFHSNMLAEANSILQEASKILSDDDELSQRQHFACLVAKMEHTESILSDYFNGRDTYQNDDEKAVFDPVENINRLQEKCKTLNDYVDQLVKPIENEEKLTLHLGRLKTAQNLYASAKEEILDSLCSSNEDFETVESLFTEISLTEEKLTVERNKVMRILEDNSNIIAALAKAKNFQADLKCTLQNHCDNISSSNFIFNEVFDYSETIEKSLKQEEAIIQNVRKLLAAAPSLNELKLVKKCSVYDDSQRSMALIEESHNELCAMYDGIKTRSCLLEKLSEKFCQTYEELQMASKEISLEVAVLLFNGNEHVTYDRLVKAVERLQVIVDQLDGKAKIIPVLQDCGDELKKYKSDAAKRRVDELVNGSIDNFNGTVQSAVSNTRKYNRAAELWTGYIAAFNEVNDWCESILTQVYSGSKETSIKEYKNNYPSYQMTLDKLTEMSSEIAEEIGLTDPVLLKNDLGNLTEKLTKVHSTLSSLTEATKKKEELNEKLNNTFCSLENIKQDVAKSSEKGDLNELGNHIINLGKVSSQINIIESERSRLSSSNHVEQVPSTMEALEGFKDVFAIAFQEYQQLSSRLVQSEANSSVLELCTDYRSSIEQFLSSPIPSDETALMEHQHLCRVHSHLLNSQRALILQNMNKAELEPSTVERMNNLTNLHNEVSIRILERHNWVKDQLDTWKKYRFEYTKFLSWLKDIEDDKRKLKLHFIRRRFLETTLKEMKVLLERIDGDDKCKRMKVHLDKLLPFCSESVSSPIQAQYGECLDKLQTIEAFLRSWQSFFERALNQMKQFDEEVENAQQLALEISNQINSSEDCPPASAKRKLQILQSLRENQLKRMKEKIGQLEGISDEVKTKFHPSDLKDLNRKIKHLQQQHDNLNMQITLQCCKLSDKLESLDLFNQRYAKFIDWKSNFEKRLEKLTSGYIDADEALQQLDLELLKHILIKEQEVKWLLKYGSDLVSVEEANLEQQDPDKLAESKLKDLNWKMTNIEDYWNQVTKLTDTKTKRLKSIIRNMQILEEKIKPLKEWFDQIEIRLNIPPDFNNFNDQTFNEILAGHEKLAQEVGRKGSEVGEITNMCDLIINECDQCNLSLNASKIAPAQTLVDRRWENIVANLCNRKSKFLTLWTEVRQLLGNAEIFRDKHLKKHEIRLEELSNPVKFSVLQDRIPEVESLLIDIEGYSNEETSMEITLKRLAREKFVGKLKKIVKPILERSGRLRESCRSLLEELQKRLNMINRFNEIYSQTITALFKLDAELSQIEIWKQSGRNEPDAVRAFHLLNLDLCKSLLQESDIVAEELLQGEKFEENKKAIQSFVSEYQSLWQKILERHSKLRKELASSYSQKQVVDEYVQVETLRMETDSQVQVNTLPLSLLKHQNYLKELKSALVEFENNIAVLEDTVKRNSIGNMPHLTCESRMTISKRVASCESSSELVKHLNCLVSMSDSSFGPHVQSLTDRFHHLKASSQIKKLNDFSEIHKFNCPVCSACTWQQLENDFWRLEKWLEHAENVQKSLQRIPSNLEDLEDIIMENKEFFLNLESHKNLLRSLNSVGSHLESHSDFEDKAQEVKGKLVDMNARWDLIQDAATGWKSELQSALTGNEELYSSLQDFERWIEKMENKVKSMTPVDLSEGTGLLVAKYNKFMNLHHDLEVFEPRVASLQSVVQELLRESDDQALYSRLNEQRSRLKVLIRTARTNILKLGSTLGKDPLEIRSIFSSSTSNNSLLSLSHELLDETSDVTHASYSGRNDQTDQNEMDGSDKPWFLRRRVWCTTLPVQAAMLMMLAAAVFIPGIEDDYLCQFSGSMARSFSFNLQYPDGAPPV